MSGAVLAVLAAGRAVQIIVTPAFAYGFGSGGAITSDSVTASASAGVPVSFSWIKLSGGSITAGTPSSASTTFSGAGFVSPGTRSAVFACDVTVDGVVYRSPDVPVTLERF